MKIFTTKENRRTGLGSGGVDVDGVLTISEETDSSNMDPSSKPTADIYKAICSQFDRCKAVISKLHDDCNNVAKLNGDIMEQVQICDSKIRENLKHKKTGQFQPQRSQDVFDQLVRDIAELTSRHSRDTARDRDTKAPCLRIVKEMGECVLSRISALTTDRKTSTKEPERGLNETTSGDPMLDSLAQLQQNLLRYSSEEIRVTDAYRRMSRVKQLQKVSHTASSKPLREVDEILGRAGNDDNRDSVHRARALLNNMADEYDEMVGLLQKLARSNSEPDVHVDSPRTQRSPRRKPQIMNGIPKSKRHSEGETMDTNATGVGQGVAKCSSLRPLIENLLTAFQAQKDSLATLKMKYQADIDKRKREFDAFTQKQVMHSKQLSTQIAELTAEKDKYKKLYDSTKVSYFHKT